MIFGINTTSDISKLFDKISRAARQVKFGTILKYHKWYLWQISHVQIMLLFVYIMIREISATRKFFKFISPANLHQITCFQPSLYEHLAMSTCIFVFSEFCLISKISWAWNSRNLSTIFFNSASNRQVAMETVIFTCSISN